MVSWLVDCTEILQQGTFYGELVSGGMLLVFESPVAGVRDGQQGDPPSVAAPRSTGQ